MAAQKDEPVLTPGQRLRGNSLNVDWQQSFELLKKTPLRGQIKAFWFKILNSANNWRTNTPCACGQIIDSLWHIIQCGHFKKCIRAIQLITSKTLHFNIMLVPRLFYCVNGSVPFRTIHIISLWTIWRVRNKFIFNNQQPSAQFAANLFRSELERALNIQHYRSKEKFEIRWLTRPNIKITNNMVEIQWK